MKQITYTHICAKGGDSRIHIPYILEHATIFSQAKEIVMSPQGLYFPRIHLRYRVETLIMTTIEKAKAID